MKPNLLLIFLFSFFTQLQAQTVEGTTAEYDPKGFGSSFDSKTKIVSFSMGFPNLYRISYDEPAGYKHIKTTGFGPFYGKFEFAGFDHVGLCASFAYSTFHYSYYDIPSHQRQVIYFDDVNTLSLTLSANYHFNKWITNPRLDVYAGAGMAANYLRYRYGNIPPYREAESKSEVHPLFRAGGRYYIDPIFGVFGEAGYDGLSIIQLGFSVKF
jgi:hypothetical protein